MTEIQSGRLERLGRMVGQEGLEKLSNATVAVFGLGGVGGSCVEALARGGVGTLILVDGDEVQESNINRQAIAFYSTIGRRKVDVMRAMVADIAPETRVITHDAFILPEDDIMPFLDPCPDYVIDAVDTVGTKLALAQAAERIGASFVGSMGAANKRFPEMLAFADIHKTSMCPLCKAVRKQARKLGIQHMRVLYSREAPAQVKESEGSQRSERTELGTLSYMPPIMGQMLAGDVIRRILGIEGA